MNIPPSIPRKKGTPAGDSFDGLKRSGIALLQNLAGEVWTDYNEHDPGVTILENVCYALTDIMYRSDFPVADFLVGADGVIDWKRQNLLPPEYAFPCRPTTSFDYCAIMLDKFEELQSIQFDLVTKPDGTTTGLYRIRLSLRLDATEQAQQHHPSDHVAEIKTKVLHEYARWRNLCEDVESIDVIPVRDYVLKARVHIKEGADPAEILAKIYVVCGAKLAAGIEFTSFDQQLNQGKTPEQIFRSPFTEHGVAVDHGAPPTDFSASEVFALIKTDVPGVEDVQVTSDAMSTDSSDTAPAPMCLRLPRAGEDIPVKLFCHGQERTISVHEFRMRYIEELNASIHGPSYKQGSIASILPRPQGQSRNLTDYASVQYQFPKVYGLGPRGISDSAPASVKAQNLQLKAYLLFFDQHMADYLAMLGNLRQLFSSAIDRKHTYFFQDLQEDAFPGIDQLVDDHPRAIQRLRGRFRQEDRVKRLLNYLLALYGESFPSDFPRASDPEQAPKDEQSILEAMIGYLADIASITRDRAAATDYTRPAGRHNRVGLEAKLDHLLCFEQQKAEGNAGVRVIEHVLLRAAKLHHHHAGSPAEDFFSFRITVLFPDWLDRCQDENFRTFAENLVDSNCPAHIYADIYWINRSHMELFDDLYENWRQHHANTIVPPSEPEPTPEHSRSKEADHPATQLVRFLRELEKLELEKKESH